MKRQFSFLMVVFLSLQMFALLPADDTFRSLTVKAQSGIFFTQTENCYALELVGIAPSEVQIELPDLPHGTRFVSSKKEEFFTENGSRGTLVSLWFTFSETGQTRFPPLTIKINGEPYYFEFESVTVYENPNLISPVLEIRFDKANITSNKNGKKTLYAHKGEKISFTVAIRYGVQILHFGYTLPKDSIFTETERFSFANGATKVTEFTTDAKNLARFEWQILKDGVFPLPDIFAEAIAFNGEKKRISLPQTLEIAVNAKKYEKKSAQNEMNHAIFASAFEKSDEEETESAAPSRADFKKMAERERLSFFERLSLAKYAIFSGGALYSVPEEKSAAHIVTGGQKVKITERVGDWNFIDCPDFSGWTKRENLYEIK